MKKEEQHEKGHSRMRGNNLFVGLMIISGWRTAPPVGTEAGEEKGMIRQGHFKEFIFYPIDKKGVFLV